MALQVAGLPPINLNDSASLLRKRLTPDQADQRLRILEVQQEALLREGSDLSPRSTRELRELAELASEDSVKYSVTITRQDPSQFYHVEFNTHPQVAAIRAFNRIGPMINSMTQHIGQVSELRILEALVAPKEEMKWYQAETLCQMHAILKTDFLDGLKYAYMAGLNLLQAARCLYKDPKVYQQITKVHAKAFDLYEDQIQFNRSCEMNILEHSQVSQKELENMRDLVLRSGEKLDTPPEDFLPLCNAVIERESRHAAQLYLAIEASATTFLGKLAPLSLEIDTCIQAISQSSLEVASLIKLFDEALKKKQALGEKEQAIQRKFESYQETKAKEFASRQAEKTGGGFMMVSWSSTEIVEADLGSKDLFAEYQELGRESKVLATELKKLEGQLATQLQAHASQYATAEELNQGAQSLSAAFSAVKQLENAIKIKQSQAKSQVELIQRKLQIQDQGQQEIKNIQHAVGYLDILRNKLLNSHAIWIQSHKQCFTMQAVRRGEDSLRTLLMADLAEGKDTGLKAIRTEINRFALTGADDVVTSQMLTNEQLLEEQKKLTQ